MTAVTMAAVFARTGDEVRQAVRSQSAGSVSRPWRGGHCGWRSRGDLTSRRVTAQHVARVTSTRYVRRHVRKISAHKHVTRTRTLSCTVRLCTAVSICLIYTVSQKSSHLQTLCNFVKS